MRIKGYIVGFSLVFASEQQKTLIKRKYTAGGFDLIFEEKLLVEQEGSFESIKAAVWEHLR